MMNVRRASQRRAVTVKQKEATSLLNRASDGEIAAAADLLPLVYDELRALAQSFFHNERDSHTLQPTALVHEAYMRLVDQSSIEWRSRNQFFVIAAKAMRNILVDHARGKRRIKRGGPGVAGESTDSPQRCWQEVTLDTVLHSINHNSADEPLDMLALHEALDQLARLDERKARLVELRFFAGLNENDAAEVLSMARSTASEEWRMARAWLHRALKGDKA
jgi:RNA polymerase sigma factor (TIGR02999 family)